MKKLKQIFRFDNKKKVITTLSLLLMILVCIAASYSFFVLYLNNDKSEKINLNTGTLHLVFSDNDNGINAKLKFEESVVKKFTIENIGTREASLSLDVKDLVNTYMNRSLTYNLSYSETEDGEYKTIIPESNMPTSSTGLTQTIASELSVPAGDTYYYNLTIKLNSLDDVEQTPDLDAYLNTKFQVSDPLKYRYYTLRVDPNGGTWGEFTTPQEYKLKNNETKTVSEVPTRTGYTFKGWKLEGVSSEFKNNKFTMGISDAVLTANWSTNKYTLSIDPNGGEYEGDKEIAIDYDATVNVGEPTRVGYTFEGWTVEGGTLINGVFTQKEDKNSKLTANWMPIAYAYKVIHRQMDVDGSGYTVIDEINNTANYGTKITPTVNTYTGFTSPSAKTITIETDTSTNVITYDYVRNQYTLTIQPNYGNYNGSTSNTTKKVYYGGIIALSTPTRKGYTFGGWEVTNGTVNDDNIFTQSTDKNAIVKAKWIVNNYDYLVYHRQMNIGGSTYTLKDTDTGKADFGTTINPPVKTYTGFTSPAVKSLTINTTGNTVDYNYTRIQYTLTVNLDGGTQSTTPKSTLYYGESITLTAPTKRGYTFNGWEIVSGTGATLDNNTFTMGSTNASIKAKWTVNKYQTRIAIYLMNTDGVTYNNISYSMKSLNYGTTITETPTDRTGFTTPASQTLTVSDSTSDNNINFYYTRNKYNLTINPNGGTYNSSTSSTKQSLYFEQEITINNPTKYGYNFTNWSKTGGTFNGSTFTMPASEVTLTANYSPKQFTVTFNPNGGTVTTGSKIVTYDSTYGELPIPTYAGYEFLGWYTGNKDGYDVTENDKVVLTENQTLFAHWQKSYTTETNATLAALKVQPQTQTNDVLLPSPNSGIFNWKFAENFDTETLESLDELIFSSSYYSSYYFLSGDSFTLNEETGKFTINNIQKVSTTVDLTGKYILVSYSLSSSQATKQLENNGNVKQIYYVEKDDKDSKKITYKTINSTLKSPSPFGDGDTGIFAEEDDYGTSYYYRGNVENNYVKFGKWNTSAYYFWEKRAGSTTIYHEENSKKENYKTLYEQGNDMYWRIIRVNGDGSLRLIYDGPKAYKNGEVSVSRNMTYKNLFNATYNDAKYVGYMYGGNVGEQSLSRESAILNETDSDMKIALDKWYENTIISQKLDKYISDTLFCNNREIVPINEVTDNRFNQLGYGKNNTLYKGYYTHFKPTLKCSQINDSFTVKKSIYGNGDLTYPVGLITKDEVAFIGWHSGNYYTTTYNFLNKGNIYWTMTPQDNYGAGADIYFADGAYSSRGGVTGSTGAGTSPVINIKAEYAAQMTGTGTATDPFVIPGVN